ncbi:MAG: carboxypeptidase-like regulatory domain-containing protein, partial [Planctomycetes bacterium]|nr:carboxypeptidase-like regulatory domain-containing protein [Planctomycetota bacterium]
LTDLPPGSLRVSAHSPGFVRDYSATAELDEAERQEMLEIVLTPSRPLRGIVMGPDGARLPMIQIEAQWSPIGQSFLYTDASGSFQVDLPEGANEITVKASGLGWAVVRQRISNKMRDEQLEITLARVNALHGRVIDTQGNPLAHAQVALFEQSQHRMARVAPWQLDPLIETKTEADGSFSLEVDPGRSQDSRFRVLAWTEQHQPASSHSLQFAQRDKEAPVALTKEIVLRLEEGLQVTGTVMTANSQPAADARVHLRRDGSSERSGGLNAGLAAASGDIVAAVTTSPRGTFVFQGIAPGDYHLEAMLPGHSPARGTNFGLVETHWQEDLQLLHRCGIRGVVRGDRNAFSRLQIIAHSEEGRSYPTLVGPNGMFEIPDLPPGAYEVDLYSDAGSKVSGIGRRQGPRLSEQQETHVLEGQWTELDFPLEVTKLAEISGIVMLDGTAAPDYRVFLVPSGYEKSEAERERQFVVDNMRSTHTDHEGHYRFAGLDESRYWVVLAPPRAAKIGGIGGITTSDGPVGLARAELEPENGERLRHDFSLQTARLTGSIVGVRSQREIKLRTGFATLIPTNAQAGVRRFRVSINRNGTYAFPPLPAGEWQLDLRSGESRLRTEPFVLAPGVIEERRDRLPVKASKR